MHLPAYPPEVSVAETSGMNATSPAILPELFRRRLDRYRDKTLILSHTNGISYSQFLAGLKTNPDELHQREHQTRDRVVILVNLCDGGLRLESVYGWPAELRSSHNRIGREQLEYTVPNSAGSIFITEESRTHRASGLAHPGLQTFEVDTLEEQHELAKPT